MEFAKGAKKRFTGVKMASIIPVNSIFHDLSPFVKTRGVDDVRHVLHSGSFFSRNCAHSCMIFSARTYVCAVLPCVVYSGFPPKRQDRHGEMTLKERAGQNEGWWFVPNDCGSSRSLGLRQYGSGSDLRPCPTDCYGHRLLGAHGESLRGTT